MRSDVLVATDDAGRARALAAQLCDAGYDVLSTTDAAVILSALRLARYRVVVVPGEGVALALGTAALLVAPVVNGVADGGCEPDGLFDELAGRSAAIRRLRGHLARIADSEASVLVSGETGTGKELVARAIHRNSPRRRGPFVAVNCAAIPAELLESELFGHERGAFTGAIQSTPGLFRQAQGGVLFLDEIGDMPLPLQAKLLRVLQEKVVRPVGGRQEHRIDVRIISATNRDLVALVAANCFRVDLYYRLAVIPVDVPSLRERADDIPLLTHDFIARTARRLGKSPAEISHDATQWLKKQRWPGNIRQLENLIECAVTLTAGAVIELDHLRRPRPDIPVSELGTLPTLAEIERDYLERVLKYTRGDKWAAARILGVSLRTIQRRLQRAEFTDLHEGEAA